MRCSYTRSIAPPNFDDLFRETFKETHIISKRILNANLNAKDKHLKALVNLALENQEPVEYPFVFRYSYAEREHGVEEIKVLAAAIHLLQTSTFIIDDIFDSSKMRNHNKTLLSAGDVNYAIISGELLQSVALETISAELERRVFSNKLRVMKIFNRIMRNVYSGQYLDLFNSSNVHITTRDYYRMIALSTGYFFADIAKCGALLANKPTSEITALTSYGYNYGMALQITDDIVDIIDKPNATGKSFANDLKCRRMRLPYILALGLVNKKDTGCLERFLSKRESQIEQVNHVAAIIKKSGAIDSCKLIAERYLSQSVKSISNLNNAVTKGALSWLSESLLRYQGLAE